MRSELERAWKWREERGLFAGTEALRVFHGAGEGSGPLAVIAIDRFDTHFWVTEWEGKTAIPPKLRETVRAEITSFLKDRAASSAVVLWRPEKGIPAEPESLFGQVPSDAIEVREGELRFLIRLQGARHPGLFLDHAPLRQWLIRRARGLRVLNTFAYTGSLSVAAGAGGAEHVTTLDLSKPVVQWAQENWALNGLAGERARFLSGDVFEWLPRFKRGGERFDCVILDPPSFSRGTKRTFSTAKDLRLLHEIASDILSADGFLITSINSANIPVTQFESDVFAAAKAKGIRFEILQRIELPESFPTRLGSPADRYLKGLILRRVG